MKPNSMFWVACLCAALCTPAVWAQGANPAASAPALPAAPTVTGPSKIGIINIRDAITATAEGKKLVAGLEARFAPRRTDLDNQQKAIAALQGQLKNGGNTMSADAKQDLTRQIQSKERDYEQTLQNDQTDFQSAQTDVLNTVGNKMMPVIDKYAQAHGYTAIVDVSFSWPQSPVLYYNPGAVITGDIVRLYDQEHPSTASTTPGKAGSGSRR